MKLSRLLAGFAQVNNDCAVHGIVLDSRELAAGDVFFALSGANRHGLVYAEQVMEKGAAAIVFDPTGLDEKQLKQALNKGFLAVKGLNEKLGKIAARFYGYPSHLLKVIGITGTNGKTSSSQFLAQMLDESAVIGTLGWGDATALKPTINTTPDAISLQKMTAELAAEKKQFLAMEASSHGLQQGRVNGMQFYAAIFTNLSRDHLDYHGDMQAYLASKLKLLNWPGLEFIVLNMDDDWVTGALPELSKAAEWWGFSAKGISTKRVNLLSAENIRYDLSGIGFDARWRHEKVAVQTKLMGRFNLENILAAMTTLLAMGYPLSEIAKRAERLSSVSGRMERFGGDAKPLVFVDYAHTPDALEKLLLALKPHCSRQLKLVFGCGGDRDTGKRALMGKVAEQWADEVIVTDDNPRSESPESITDAILAGCAQLPATVIHDRERAITTAIEQASDQDCVVIAGKGHEDYQEIGGQRLPFSDQAIVKQTLAEWGR